MRANFAPRDLASKLVESFVDNKPTPEIDPEFNHLEALAKEQARSVAALVVHHARKVRQDRGYVVPKVVWPLVRRYERSRGFM